MTPLLLVAFGACACQEGDGTTDIIPRPAIVHESGYDDEPVRGLLTYSIAGEGTPDSEDPPFLVAQFDTEIRYFSDGITMRDQCQVMPQDLAIRGTRDVGSTLGVRIDDGPEMVLDRRVNFFLNQETTYVYDDLRSRDGMVPGEVMVGGHPTGVTLGESLVVTDPTGVLERLLHDGVLDLRWTAGSGNHFVQANFTSVNGTWADGEEFLTIYCQFLDDGEATIDLSTVIQTSWPTHSLILGRTSHGYFEHPELGRMIVYTRRNFSRGVEEK